MVCRPIGYYLYIQHLCCSFFFTSHPETALLSFPMMDSAALSKMLNTVEEVPLPLLVITSVSLWIVTVAVYRLWFHPLSKFPGPKLAALTLWYETYYDVWRRGKFVHKVKEMHDVYGRLRGSAFLQTEQQLTGIFRAHHSDQSSRSPHR